MLIIFFIFNFGKKSGFHFFQLLYLFLKYNVYVPHNISVVNSKPESCMSWKAVSNLSCPWRLRLNKNSKYWLYFSVWRNPIFFSFTCYSFKFGSPENCSLWIISCLNNPSRIRSKEKNSNNGNSYFHFKLNFGLLLFPRKNFSCAFYSMERQNFHFPHIALTYIKMANSIKLSECGGKCSKFTEWNFISFPSSESFFLKIDRKVVAITRWTSIIEQ